MAVEIAPDRTIQLVPAPMADRNRLRGDGLDIVL